MLITLDRIKEKLGNKLLGCYEHNDRRVYLTIRPQDLFETVKFLFMDLHLRFATASGTDTPEGLEILYHFSIDKTPQIVSLRVLLEDKKNLRIDSIAPIFVAAEWIEREIWELLGVNFIGHPNLKHLLLIDDWPQGHHPLRHDHES